VPQIKKKTEGNREPKKVEKRNQYLLYKIKENKGIYNTGLRKENHCIKVERDENP
jgi:hypothetical protein